jgi:hypothetical protein
MLHSVYGDLNWYLQSRAATTVRPRPLQQQPRGQQPSAALRSALAPSHHNSPSAFASTSHRSTLREGFAEEGGRAPYAFPVARRFGGEEGAAAAAISEEPESAAAQVEMLLSTSHEFICVAQFHAQSWLLQIADDSVAKSEPRVVSAGVAEVVASAASQIAESFQVSLAAVESSLVAHSSDAALLSHLSDAVMEPEVAAVIVPTAESGNSDGGELHSQAQAVVEDAAAPALAIAPTAASSGVEVPSAEVSVEPQDVDTNPVLKTLQQLQVACKYPALITTSLTLLQAMQDAGVLVDVSAGAGLCLLSQLRHVA